MEKEKVHLASQHLVGAAALWHRRWESSLPSAIWSCTTTTWPQFAEQIKARFGAPPAIFTTRHVTDDEQAKHHAMPTTSPVDHATISSKLDLALDLLISMNQRWETRDPHLARDEKLKTKGGVQGTAKQRDGILGEAPTSAHVAVSSPPCMTTLALFSQRGPPLLPLPNSTNTIANFIEDLKTPAIDAWQSTSEEGPTF